MTLPISHVVPSGSLPESAMKEQLSQAYVHMLASAAGLTLGHWDTDYDCKDVSVSSSVDYSPDLYAPGFDIQLKCTGQRAVRKADTIAWSLDTRAVDKMSRLNRSQPALLCVLVVPPLVGNWLHHDPQGLLARSHMYWLWGQDLPEAKLRQKKQVVHIPSTNVLTPNTLLERMKEASQWKPRY